MRSKLTITILAALVAGLCFAGIAVAVKGFTIYANDMESASKRGQIRQLAGRNCERGGSPTALRVTIGRRTKECVYRTQVVGRNVEILVTERLLSPTPPKQRRRAFLAVSVRSGEGGRYQLKIFPLQRRYQLIKKVRGEPIQFLAAGRQINILRGINKPNRIRLRAFNMKNTRPKNDCRLLVYVNGKRLAVVTDRRSGQLDGRNTTMSTGVKRGANGVVASFDNVFVRIPNPF